MVRVEAIEASTARTKLSRTAALAAAAVTLPESFSGDPADRLIYSTAVEHGCSGVTKDRRLQPHWSPRPIAVW